jgi:hypothetical protein
VRIFRFVATKKAEHSIKIMCRVLGVSRSEFHAWAARAPSTRALADRRLTGRIAEIQSCRARPTGRRVCTPSCAWRTVSWSGASVWSG